MTIAPAPLPAQLLYAPHRPFSLWDIQIHVGLLHWLMFLAAFSLARFLFALWVEDRRERRQPGSQQNRRAA